jgi:hypothetical protein
MYHFCTYFDRHYLVRGLALYQSLTRHSGSFHLYVLCLDRETHDYLKQMDRPNLHAIALEEFEQASPELRVAKGNRSPVEYYFTCTAPLALHVLKSVPGVDVVTYVDADFCFFADPAPIYESLADRSILLIGHRFPPALRHLEIHGIYNVGLLCFRNDSRGLACLTWWRDRCLEWCYDRVEDGKFADQKYLDDWPARFPGTVVLEHKGVNLAPWNVCQYFLRSAAGEVYVDDDPLICFHFHGLRMLAPSFFNLGLNSYGAALGPVLKSDVYLPYLQTLKSLVRQPEIAGLNRFTTRRQSLRTELTNLCVQGNAFVQAGSFGMELPLRPLVKPFAWLLRRAASLRKGLEKNGSMG